MVFFLPVKLYRNKKMPMVVVAKVDVQSHIMVQPGKLHQHYTFK